MPTDSLYKIVARVLIAGACLTLWCTCANSASYDYLDPSSELISFNAGHFLLDSTGAWVTGNQTARFNADGSLAFVVPLMLPGGDALLAETADGGLIEGTIPIPDTPQLVACTLYKISASGAIQWTVLIPEFEYCVSISSGSNGVIWVTAGAYNGLGLQLLSVNADGSALTQYTFPSGFVPLAVQAPTLTGSSVTYAAGYIIRENQSTSAAVLKLDSNGVFVWQWTDPGTGSSALPALGLDAAGNVYSAGFYGSPTSADLEAISLTPAGLVRWSVRYDAPAAYVGAGFQVLADGSSYVWVHQAASTMSPVLEKLNSDGTFAWQVQSPLQGSGSSLSAVDGRLGLRIAPNGDVLALADSIAAGGLSSTNELARFDADGNLLATTVLAGATGASFIGVSSLAALPDSSALLTDYSDFDAPDGSGVDNGAAVNGVFVHLDRSGQPLPDPFVQPSIADYGNVTASVIEPDGTTFLLTQYLLTQYNQPQDYVVGGSTARYALSRVSPAGGLVWKTYLDGFWSGAQLSENADRICIGGNLASYMLSSYATTEPPAGSTPDTRLQCHATDTGAQLWVTQLRTPDNTLFTLNAIAFRVLADSTSVASYFDDSGNVELTTLDASGNIVQTHAVAGTNLAAGIGSDGSALFIAPGTAAALTTVRDDGTSLYTTALPALSSVAGAQYMDDGTVQFLGPAADGSVLVGVLSSAGTLQWVTTVADAATAANFFVFGLSTDTGDIFLTLSDGATTTQATRLNRSNGAIMWQTTNNQPFNQAGISTDLAGASVIFYTLYQHRFGFQIIDPASGNFASPNYSGCGIADCAQVTLTASQLGNDGSLRTVFNSGGQAVFVPNNSSQLVAIDSVDKTPALIPAAQPGVAGAWFAPYESGQGFVIDYIAESNLLFIPWFTYTLDGGNDPSGLAWFTLQGSAMVDATGVDLAIGSNNGGAFVSGTTAAQQVGTGHISFVDCDHGSLSYQFNSDIDGGASGVISIVRLGPATSSCRLADGSLRPAEDASAPLNGFDALQSGSWFDSSTSGQGIEFTVIPAGGGFSGLLYGAWFTFDPSGNFDDPLHQHWFTLQGDLSTANNGQVTVPIVATIGGSFDNMPTGNSTAIGQATVTFFGCASATLDYQFDSASFAHSYANLSGSVHLSKIAGCSQ
jgi:hypothetical protein